MSALHDAVTTGDLARIQALIKPEINLNPLDADSRTPLHRAIELDHVDIALELLHSGADPALRFFTGNDYGADVGMNALHFAALRGHTAIIRWIVEYADLDRLYRFL
jgi:ankyrin repeat protein